MKKLNVIIAGTCIVLFSFQGFSQVGINLAGDSPDPSAISDISFSGIINVMPGDFIDIRFAGNQNKDMRLETASLNIHRID